MESTAKKHAKARLLKKLGLLGLTVSAIFITIVLIVAILPKGNEAFTIRVDDLETTSHYRISATRGNGVGDGDQGSDTYLVGRSLGNARATTASKIEDYLENRDINGDGEKDGLDYDTMTGKEQNFYHYSIDHSGKKTEEYGYAIVYTVYLTNVTKEEQEVKYQVNLEDYVEPSTPDSAKLIDYVRLVVRTQEIDANDKEGKPEYVFFGNPLKSRLDYDLRSEKKGEDGNWREPISGFTYKEKDEKDKDGNKVVNEKGQTVTYTELVSNYDSNQKDQAPEKDSETDFNNRYCINFNSIANGNKYVVTPDIAPKLIIKPDTMVRFTFAIYFEGNDIDLVGAAPDDASMRFSLHFGY